MINLKDYTGDFMLATFVGELQPWEITAKLPYFISRVLKELGSEYTVHGQLAVHREATVETGAVIKPPAIIGPDCFIGAGAYLRGGVLLVESVTIGPGCEIKTSIIGRGTVVAHFNFIGDSIIGDQVNFEAGSVIANHLNEKPNKRIFVLNNGQLIDTGTEKFGALVGDRSRIGANAVLSPGTLLKPMSVVKRLELIEQV